MLRIYSLATTSIPSLNSKRKLPGVLISILIKVCLASLLKEYEYHPSSRPESVLKPFEKQKPHLQFLKKREEQQKLSIFVLSSN
jgi:hypothetical protein